MCRSLHHPNIVMMLGSIVEEACIIFIMNLVDGSDLQSLIFNESKRKLQKSEKVYISIQICQALLFLHTCVPQLAYLDIKPPNILIENNLLSDFVVSRIISSTNITSTSASNIGTPGYQSPEQLRAEVVDIMCDVYVFGAVMVVLFGEVLWEGLSAFQIMCKITCENQFPSTKHLDNEIQAICKMPD